MIRSYDMGYISTRMMECEDAFSDMGSLKQNLELPPEYAFDEGERSWKKNKRTLTSASVFLRVSHIQSSRASCEQPRSSQNVGC